MIAASAMLSAFQCGRTRSMTLSFPAGLRDTGLRDPGVLDPAVLDTGVLDAGVLDIGVRDTGVLDAGVRGAGLSAAASLSRAAPGTAPSVPAMTFSRAHAGKRSRWWRSFDQLLC